MIKIKSELKYVRVSPQKARIVSNKIKGLLVNKAITFLSFSKKKSSLFIKNALASAIANAEHNNGLDASFLYIYSIYINEGPVIKRFRARAKGRGNKILKRTSHIVIIISEKLVKKLKR